MRGDLELVEVRLQAVAAGDRGDRLVVRVHHDVLALAEAELEHLALPERQVARVLVALDVEVLGDDAGRELVKPDQAPRGRVDQRPVAARARAPRS